MIFFFTLRSNPFYEPTSSSAATSDHESSTLEKSTKRQAPHPPYPGPNPAVLPGGLAPKTSAFGGTTSTPVPAPSAVAAVMGRELASSSPKVRCSPHSCTAVRQKEIKAKFMGHLSIKNVVCHKFHLNPYKTSTDWIFH